MFRVGKSVWSGRTWSWRLAFYVEDLAAEWLPGSYCNGLSRENREKRARDDNNSMRPPLPRMFESVKSDGQNCFEMEVVEGKYVVGRERMREDGPKMDSE